MVDTEGIEPPTLSLSEIRSNQLSYVSLKFWWQWQDSNLLRKDFQSSALPLSYTAIIILKYWSTRQDSNLHKWTLQIHALTFLPQVLIGARYGNWTRANYLEDSCSTVKLITQIKFYSKSYLYMVPSEGIEPSFLDSKSIFRPLEDEGIFINVL